MKDIINKNRQRIRQIIKKFTGTQNEDLEQEVYIKTYLHLDKYRERNKFTQWISTITANICRDYLKSSYFRHQTNSTTDDNTINSIKSRQNPEKELTNKERQKIILKEINALPKKMKEVIILYEFEDYSYEKISQILKVPQGTVKSRMNNARKILKEKLSFLLAEDKD